MATENETLLDALYRRRDEERRLQPGKKLVVREEDAVRETNRQGIMRWYLHPEKDDACIKSLIVYRYEIPSGGHTGRQRVQGNLAGYCIKGYGRVVVDGVSHEWEGGDVIGLPPMREGHEIQVFNESENEAQILFAQPNFMAIFGVDCGSGFEQLDEAGDHPAAV